MEFPGQLSLEINAQAQKRDGRQFVGHPTTRSVLAVGRAREPGGRPTRRKMAPRRRVRSWLVSVVDEIPSKVRSVFSGETDSSGGLASGLVSRRPTALWHHATSLAEPREMRRMGEADELRHDRDLAAQMRAISLGQRTSTLTPCGSNVSDQLRHFESYVCSMDGRSGGAAAATNLRSTTPKPEGSGSSGNGKAEPSVMRTVASGSV